MNVGIYIYDQEIAKTSMLRWSARQRVIWPAGLQFLGTCIEINGETLGEKVLQR